MASRPSGFKLVPSGGRTKGILPLDEAPPEVGGAAQFRLEGLSLAEKNDLSVQRAEAAMEVYCPICGKDPPPQGRRSDPLLLRQADGQKVMAAPHNLARSIRPKILPHTKVIKGREYCMYFPLL